MALVGGDLPESDGGGGFAAEDATECQFECERRANCRFWSHVDEWKVSRMHILRSTCTGVDVIYTNICHLII